MAVTREKLYEEIWAEPITKVSKHYGVSDSFLVRVLQRLNVPRPPMGYWAKLAVGKIVPKPPLPEPGPSDELEWSRDGMPKLAPRAAPKPPDPARAARIRKRADRPARHLLIAEARPHFENVDETDGSYLKPTKKLMVDLIASKPTLNRALDVANELFLLLEDRGHHVMIAPPDREFRRPALDEREESRSINHFPRLWQPYRSTVVFIGTVAIGLTLFEMSEEVEVRRVDGKFVRVSELPVPNRRSWAYPDGWTLKHDLASGRLCLQAYSPYHDTSWKQQWRETRSVDLKSKLKTIARELAEAATIIAEKVAEADRRAEIRRREWEVQQEQWRREREEQRRKDAIKESREELYAIIEAWGETKRIEGFFSEAEQLAQGLNDEDRQSLMNRLKEARAQMLGPDALKRFLAWKSAEERLKD